MKIKNIIPSFCLSFAILISGCANKDSTKTIVSIQGEDFYINGEPTLDGVSWKGINMEGLIPNFCATRIVIGIKTATIAVLFTKAEAIAIENR